MDITQELAEKEALQLLLAHYAIWGDTQQWDQFESLFHEDVEVRVDAGPRANKDADPAILIKGRGNFIGGMRQYMAGTVSAHQFYLPDITIIDASTASAIWSMHDYVKTPAGIFSGWGHMRQEYVKIDGEWKIRKVHTTRTIVDEEWN